MAISTFQRYPPAFYLKLLTILIAVLTVRMCVSLWGHSGEGKPPMFGDFEAQRHWMEVTVNLPVKEWYVQGPRNDLQYWGLDYPPLTAYHMMLNGFIAQRVNPSMVALNQSHGLEDPGVKFFMRCSVLALDLLFFLPVGAAYFVFQRSKAVAESDILGFVAVLIGYPGLILIDNGHFQYNNVSLGLFVLATIAIRRRRDFVGAFLFCCALNYKQMELYHALPFFAYLLGSCLKAGLSEGISKLVKLGLIVLATFAAVWTPFLQTKESILAVIQRLFPFKRGLYEDKVANFWCSSSIIIKFKDIFSDSNMALICLVVTSLFLLPSFLHLLKNPTIRNFHYTLINISLVFFLFSFHVHEKSILLATIPSCLVMESDPLASFWFLLISVFSMLPLLIKDGLLIPTLAIVCLFWITVTYILSPSKHASPLIQKAFRLSLIIAACIVLATLLIPPPKQYPDIFPLIISIYSCGHFLLFALNFHVKQFGIESFLYKITLQNVAAIDFVSENSKSNVSTADGNTKKSLKRKLQVTDIRHRKIHQ